MESVALLASIFHERKGEAFLVYLAPQPECAYNDCHTNVANYVRTHPECQPVRGWLVEEFDGFTRFNAHSVVMLPNNSLMDITPTRRPCPFLLHWGTKEEFERLKRWPYVQYPPIDPVNFECSAPIGGENEGDGFDFE